MLDDELDQFIAGDKGEDDPRNGDNDVFRYRMDHGVDAGFKDFRCGSHLVCDAADLLVDSVEQAGEIVHDAAGEDPFQPVGQFFEDAVQGRSPPGQRAKRVMSWAII